MLTKENLQQWIKDLFNCIDNKDVACFSHFLCDDVLFRFGNMPVSCGKPAVVEQVSGFFASIKALEHDVVECWLQDDAVTCHGMVNYTRHDDSTLQVPFANVFKIHQQCIDEYLIFADVSGLYPAE